MPLTITAIELWYTDCLPYNTVYGKLVRAFSNDLEGHREVVGESYFQEVVNSEVMLASESQGIHEDTGTCLVGLIVHGYKLTQVRNSWTVS